MKRMKMLHIGVDAEDADVILELSKKLQTSVSSVIRLCLKYAVRKFKEDPNAFFQEILKEG